MQGQNVDDDDLNAALNYFASYKSYAAEELPRIPPDYRGALLQAAEGAAAKAMWLSLKEHNDQSHAYGVFNVQAPQAVALQKAFIELRRSDLATRLQSALNRRALNQVVDGWVKSSPSRCSANALKSASGTARKTSVCNCMAPAMCRI